MLRRNNKQEYNIGFDIGTHTARAIITKITSTENEFPEIIAVAQTESKGMRNGYITHIQGAKETLQSLVYQLKQQSNFEVKRANISIGGISLNSSLVNGDVVVSRADGIISQNDIDKAINEAHNKLDLVNREILHTIPVAYKIDGKDVLGRPLGMRGSKLEVKVFFVICLAQHLFDLIDLFSDIGIEIQNIVASPIAASCVALTDTQKHNGVMLANIGAETVSVIVYEKGMPLSLHVFPIGGSDFTKDIALGLKIGVEEAELVKTGKNQGLHSERKLNEIIEARLRDIFELLEKYLKKINRDALLPAGIVITGGGSHISQIESLARNSLRLPCKVGIPEHLLQMKPRIRDVSWMVSYGLTMYKEENQNPKAKLFGDNNNFTSKIKSFFHDLMP